MLRLTKKSLCLRSFRFPVSSFCSFAPLQGNLVAVFEKPPQPRFDQKRRCGASEKPQRWLVVYFIAEDSTIRTGPNEVPMAPAAKRTRDLHIFEHPRWIIGCVFGDPACRKRSQNSCFDYGARAELGNRGRCDDFRALPRWR